MSPTSTSTRTLQVQHRRNDIQGLRAVAVLMVMAFHADLPFPGGFVGVDVFFVISGFVITGMLQREWEQRGSISFKAFFLRRFKRLVPALALVTTVTVVISVVLLSPAEARRAAQTAIGAMFSLANAVIAYSTGGYFDAPAEQNPLLNTWSLSVEEQFYVIFPILLFIGWTIARRSRVSGAPVMVVAALGLTSLGFVVVGAVSTPPTTIEWLFGFYSPFTRAWEFAAGAILALVLARHTPSINSRWTAFTAIAGLCLVIGSLWLINADTPFPGIWTFLPVGGTLLLILAGSLGNNPVSSALSAKPMVEIGNWSYSLYLWHWPLIVFAGFLLPDQTRVLVFAAALSFLPAIASYYFVEQPIRCMSVSNRRRLVRLIAVVMLPPVIVSSVTIFLAQSNRVYPESRDSDWAAEQLDCPDYPLLDDPKCWIRLDSAEAPVFLLGDSNATMFSDAVYGGTTRPVFKGHAGRCPFIALDKTSEDCRIFYEMTIGNLSQQKPGTVVLAFSDAYFWDRSVNHDMGNYGDSADLQAGLSKTIRHIKDAGHDVVVILPVHVFNGTPFTWQKCSLLTAVVEGCNLGIPRQYVSDVQRNTRNAISEAAAQHGAQTIDVRPFLCDEDTCPIQRDNRFLYADEAHISAGLSSSLAPHFSKYL